MDKPNILLVMCDQLKATASHLYGNSFCETPALARLAREGVLYKHAFTPHPLCVPARTSLWTSQYPHSHGARRNQTLMPEKATHAFQIWKRAGYHCALIGKNHCFVTQEDLELFDTWLECSHRGLLGDAAPKGMEWVYSMEEINKAHAGRGALPQQTPSLSYGTTDVPLEKYASGLLAEQTIAFLEKHQSEPFAVWLSFPDPHAPKEAPRKYAEMFPPEKIELPPRSEEEFQAGRAPERNRVLHAMIGLERAPLEHVYGALAAYYGMVRFLDDSLGKILDALERLQMRDNTIVVFCSDHGDFAGEHGMMDKGGMLYDCLTRVPLVVSWPGRIDQGVVDESMVNLIDIVPTLLRLQNCPIPPSMQGNGLPGITNAPPRDAAFSEYGAGGPPFARTDLENLEVSTGEKSLNVTLQWREAEGRRKMVRTARWKYVHDPMGDLDELYDLEKDPAEQINVALKPQNAGVIAEMQKRLMDWCILTEDARPVPLPSSSTPASSKKEGLL